VARIDEDTWLCHTTSGGADRIHGHMEDWLQCEWWDWQVFTANVTEQYAQVAVVGPNARKLLEKLGGMDVSKEALPFMTWADGTLGGFPVRAYRISFSGELSYEIAVPASHGLAFWNACVAAGEGFGLMPYGTEALHVLRAEKGFIMIGDETDGTVIPQDLGLAWAISKKKPDYLGKRGQERQFLASGGGWWALKRWTGRSFPMAPMRWPKATIPTGSATCRAASPRPISRPRWGAALRWGWCVTGRSGWGKLLNFQRSGAGR
jgi:sarcosine oxidase subunit alpha